MADSMWVETLQLMNSDLKWLLGLCYDDFWNQVYILSYSFLNTLRMMLIF